MAATTEGRAARAWHHRVGSGRRSLTDRARSPVGAAVNGKGAELVTQALFITLLPRVLGPNDYGRLAAAIAVVMIGSAGLTLGGQAVMTRFVPAAGPDEREALARALSGRMLRWTAIQLALALTVLAVVAAAVPDRIPPVLAALIGLALVLDVAATRAFQTALGLGRTVPWAFRYAVQNSAVIVAALAFAGTGDGTAAAGAVVVGSAAALVLGLVATADLWRRTTGPRPEVPLPADARRFGLLQGLAGALGMTLVRGAAPVVIVFGGSTAEAGFAALALGVAMALNAVVLQASIARLPGLVETWTRDPARAETEAVRLCERSLLVVVPLAVVGALVADAAMTAVVGDRFRGAEAALVPALAMVVLAPQAALGMQLASLALRPGLRAAAAGAGVVTFLVVAALTVPHWGATGATAAVLAGTVASIAVAAVEFRQLLAPRLLRISLAGTALVLALATWT